MRFAGLPRQRGGVAVNVQAGMDALKNGDSSGAINIFTSVLEQNRNLAVAHVGLGRAFARQGDHRKALEHFQEALELNEDMAPAILFSAESREKLGETDQALLDYEDALAADPLVGRGQFRMSRLLEKQNRQDDAIRHLKEAIQRAPHDVSLRLLLAGMYERGGDQAASGAELERAVELRPDMWITHYQAGRARLRNKDFKAARSALERAVSIAPDKALLRFALGTACQKLGLDGKAAEEFGEAFRLNPRMIRAAVDAALCKSRLGRHDEALADLSKSLRKRRQIPALQRAIGDVYLAMGKHAQAIDHYRAAVMNAPEGGAEHPPEFQEILVTKEGDPKTLAERFHNILADRAERMGDEMRENPSMVRQRIKSRVSRVTG